MSDGPTNDPLDNPNDKTVFWDLTGCNVTVSASRTTKLASARTLAKRLSQEKTANVFTRGDVSWIPDLSRVTPTGKAKINPACLASDPRPAKVAARITVRGGELSAIFRNTIVDYGEVLYRFEPQPVKGAYEQALGAARLARQIAGPSVTFTAQKFDGSGAPRKVVLRAPAYSSMSSSGPLEVGLTNEPDAAACTNPASVAQLDHFRAYYDLLDARDRPVDKFPIPHLTGNVKPPCGPQLSEVVWCPPGGAQP